MDDSAPAPDMSAPPPTIAEAIRARAADSAARVFLRAGEQSWTFAETYREACRYARFFLRARDAGRPFHRRLRTPPGSSSPSLAGAGGAARSAQPSAHGSALARDIGVLSMPSCGERAREQLQPLSAAARCLLDCVAGHAAGASSDGTPSPTAAIAIRSTRRRAEDRLLIGADNAPKGVLNSHGLLAMPRGASQFMCHCTAADASTAPCRSTTPSQALALARRWPARLARPFQQSDFLADFGATRDVVHTRTLSLIRYTPGNRMTPTTRRLPTERGPRSTSRVAARSLRVIDVYGSSEVGVGSPSRQHPPRRLGRAPGVNIRARSHRVRSGTLRLWRRL